MLEQLGEGGRARRGPCRQGGESGRPEEPWGGAGATDVSRRRAWPRDWKARGQTFLGRQEAPKERWGREEPNRLPPRHH